MDMSIICYSCAIVAAAMVAAIIAIFFIYDLQLEKFKKATLFLTLLILLAGSFFVAKVSYEQAQKHYDTAINHYTVYLNSTRIMDKKGLSDDCLTYRCRYDDKNHILRLYL